MFTISPTIQDRTRLIFMHIDGSIEAVGMISEASRIAMMKAISKRTSDPIIDNTDEYHAYPVRPRE